MTLPLRFYNLNFNPDNPVPNGPFFSPPDSYLQGPYSPWVIGSGLFVDPITSTISAIGGGGGGGGISSLTAGAGIQLTPSTIISSGSIALAPAGVATGTYTYPTITVDTFGRVTFVSSNPAPSTTVVAPITNTGSASAPVIGIQTATTTQLGAVRIGTNINVASGTISVGSSSTSTTGIVALNDTLLSTSSTEALTAAQGKILQDQINALSAAGGLALAGTFDAAASQMLTVTAAGTGAGFAVGNNIPAAAVGNTDYFVIVTTGGSYSPPGGGGPFNTSQGDWFLSDGTSWQYLNVGTDLPIASTGTAGIVELATDAETQTGTDATLAVTPAGAAATYIPQAALTGKGAIISASGAGVVETLTVGTNGQVLVACSTAASGLCWSSSAAAIPCAAVTAKGALLTGTAPGAVTALPVGTNGQVLFADSACSSGLKWGPSPVASLASPTVSGTIKGCVVSTNTALGCNVGVGSTNNVYIGFLAANTAGANTSNNVAIGSCAGRCLTTGSSNTLIGCGAGFGLTTSICNVIIGRNAGVCGPGSQNILIGTSAGSVTTGSGSIYIGTNAGCTATNTSGDLIIGNNSWVTGGGGGVPSVIIGNNIVCGTPGWVTIGRGSCRCATFNYQTAIGWDFVSDARLKDGITALPVNAEAFINNLRPVTYCFLDQETKQPIETKHCVAGFIAQEVEQALEASNLSEITAMVSKPQSEDDYYRLADAGFTPFVVKAIQELSAKIASLEAKLAD
jgi:hypothetical protein